MEQNKPAKYNIAEFAITGHTPCGLLVESASGQRGYIDSRTFGSLSPSGRIDLPNTPGVYKITTEDGEAYVGKASDIRRRIHDAFRSGGALHDLGYTTDQVRALDWMEMPGATEGELFDMENQWIESGGGIGRLANRINSPGRP